MQLWRQQIKRDCVTRTRGHRFHQQVLEFPNVARPSVSIKGFHHLCGDSRNAFVELAVNLPKQVGYKRWQVLEPVFQSGHRDIDHLKPVKQVFTEAVIGNQLLQVRVACRDDSGIRLPDFLASHRQVFFLLEHSQQLGLDVGRKFSHLIKKDGAILGQGKLSWLTADCAGECPFLMAEHVRLQQSLDQCCTVNSNKRAIRGRTHPVQISRYQFLPGTAGPRNMHGHRLACYQPNSLENFFHRPTITNHGVTTMTCLVFQHQLQSRHITLAAVNRPLHCLVHL